MTAEKIHLMINHFPVVGALLAFLVLLGGFIFRSKPVLISGLVVAFLSFLFVPFIMSSGEEAFLRYAEGGELAEMITEEGKKAMHQHEQWAHSVSKLGYIVLGLVPLGLILFAKTKKWLTLTAGIVLLISGAFFGLILKSNNLGGKIRRPDFITESEKKEWAELPLPNQETLKEH